MFSVRGDGYEKPEVWYSRPPMKLYVCAAKKPCSGTYIDGSAAVHTKRTGHKTKFVKEI